MTQLNALNLISRETVPLTAFTTAVVSLVTTWTDAVETTVTPSSIVAGEPTTTINWHCTICRRPSYIGRRYSAVGRSHCDIGRRDGSICRTNRPKTMHSLHAIKEGRDYASGYGNSIFCHVIDATFGRLGCTHMYGIERKKFT